MAKKNKPVEDMDAKTAAKGMDVKTEYMQEIVFNVVDAKTAAKGMDVKIEEEENA